MARAEYFFDSAFNLLATRGLNSYGHFSGLNAFIIKIIADRLSLQDRDLIELMPDRGAWCGPRGDLAQNCEEPRLEPLVRARNQI